MKKTVIPTDQVREFMDRQPQEIQEKYDFLLEQLGESGFLIYPYGEKIENGLFCIRILMKNNIRIFYYYEDGDDIIAFHAFSKKTQKLSDKDRKNAIRLMKRTKIELSM